MAFTDAVFEGQAFLEKVTAVRHDLAKLQSFLPRSIPLVVADFEQLLESLQPEILVDVPMLAAIQTWEKTRAD